MAHDCADLTVLLTLRIGGGNRFRVEKIGHLKVLV